MAVDAQTFKNTLAQWASGVTVLTTRLQEDGVDQMIGITASSFSSVSLEPARVLVCVSRRLHTHGVIERSGNFAVNILGTDHLEWGMRFAGMIPEVEDRFAGIDWTTAVTGAPILPGVSGWVDCRLAHAYDGGDHTIFVGDVLAAGSTAEKSPLLYFNRHWRQLDAAPLQFP
jgi:flavin reductase (DIM6/NTAB) family NADH-FMN oxidoreductase RutF